MVATMPFLVVGSMLAEWGGRVVPVLLVQAVALTCLKTGITGINRRNGLCAENVDLPTEGCTKEHWNVAGFLGPETTKQSPGPKLFGFQLTDKGRHMRFLICVFVLTGTGHGRR